MSYFQEQLQYLRENDRQWDAYVDDGNCVVQAGPGSGKTATLTMKIVRLLNEKISPPRGLACLTYNNEAVKEFKNRLKKLGLPSRPNVFLGTVHSFCLYSVIRPFGQFLLSNRIPQSFTIPTENVLNQYLQKAMDANGIQDPIWDFKVPFHRYRRSNIYRNTPEWGMDRPSISSTIIKYESLLHDDGYVDFDDLVLCTLEMIESNELVRRSLIAKYPWIVVDEYQDLGYPLHRIILALIETAGAKVFAVGDPDQSIYGFTGADPRYLSELSSRHDFNSYRLQLNYRCGQNIIDGAEIILSPPNPRGYTSTSDNRNVGVIDFIEKAGGLSEQAETIVNVLLPTLERAGYEKREIAILYLTQDDGDVVIESLKKHGIDYKGEKDKRYDRSKVTRWIEDIALWCCDVRGNEGIAYRDLFDFWVGLLRDTGSSVPEERLLMLNKHFFNTLSSLCDEDMGVHTWINEIENKLFLKERLAQMESPWELNAYNSLHDGTSPHWLDRKRGF